MTTSTKFFGFFLGLALTFAASDAQAQAPKMAVGGQAYAKAGSPTAIVRVRVVLDGRSFMMAPVKVQKSGPSVRFARSFGSIRIQGSVRWTVGPTLTVYATARTPKGYARAKNSLRIKTQ